MSKLETVQQSVLGLSNDELQAFETWFDVVKQDLWDAQFTEDVHAGRLDSLAAKAKADFQAGHFVGIK